MPKSGLCPTLIKLLQKVLDAQMHRTSRTIHSMHLNSLEKCNCTSTMTIIRSGRDSKPLPLRLEPHPNRMRHNKNIALFFYHCRYFLLIFMIVYLFTVGHVCCSCCCYEHEPCRPIFSHSPLRLRQRFIFHLTYSITSTVLLFTSILSVFLPMQSV